MKVIFLDIDGVVNSQETLKRGDANGGILGIDPYLAFMVGRISLALPDVKFVLSSSWRHWPHGRERVEEQVVPIYDITGIEPYQIYGEDKDTHTQRGREIKKWLEAHPEVEKYAIIDDDSDMLPEQLPNFFKTSWLCGITPEIVISVVEHLS